MKNPIPFMSLFVTISVGALAMQSCEEIFNDNDSDDEYISQIDGPKWVLVDIDAPNYTEQDILDENATSYNPAYHVDSVKFEAAKSVCSGFYSESFIGESSWKGGAFLFCFETSQIPQELEGGGTITLYNKVTLPVHNCGKEDNNSYATYHYYHCACYVDCKIAGNKIRTPEEFRDQCGGYNLPIVLMKNNEPDLYASEAPVIGDVPMGKWAGQQIELTITAMSGQAISINRKKMCATYTYEWRE